MAIKMEFRLDEIEYIRFALILAKLEEKEGMENGKGGSAKLAEFINSDWLDLLLCWQHGITPEAVCEELVRRLTS